MSKRVLLALHTGSLSSLTSAEIAKYDVVITQYDRASKIAGAKALNPGQKWYVYQNTLLMNALGSSGVSKAEADANPTWFLPGISTETYENSVARDSPPHFWKMQEPSGTTATDSGSSPANGTYNANQTLNQASITGNASLKSVSFADVGGFATSFALAASTNYTFEGWANRTNTTGIDTLIGSNGSNNRIILRMASGSNQLAFFSDSAVGGQTFSGTAPSAGTSFHWALTWDATTKVAECFINGASIGEVTLTNTINGGTVGNLSIGAWHSDLVHDPFNGKISHVAAWTTKLSAGRIAAHATNGPNTTTGGGAIIESALFSGNWIANVTNSGYRSRWNSNVITVLQANAWDGVFADDLDKNWTGHGGSVVPSDPADPYSAATQQVTIDATYLQIQNLYAAIDAAGYDVIGNISNGLDAPTFKAWIAQMDGSTREFWLKFGTGDSSGVRFVTTDFDFNSTFIQQANNTSKVFIGITYGTLADTTMQRYGWAAFLLDWSGSKSDGYAFVDQSTTGDPWTVHWTKKLGQPTNLKYNVQANANLWQRDFTGGVVCVNSSVSTVAFDLTAYPALNKADGTYAGTSLSLPSATGEILSFAPRPTLQVSRTPMRW